jgi:hypothetical protein
LTGLLQAPQVHQVDRCKLGGFLCLPAAASGVFSASCPGPSEVRGEARLGGPSRSLFLSTNVNIYLTKLKKPPYFKYEKLGKCSKKL